MIHACSIDVIKDPSTRLQFVTCMIENNIEPIEIMNKCAAEIAVDVESIGKCSNTARGKELLAKYGEMTNSLVPRVSFIPTVTLNGVSMTTPFGIERGSKRNDYKVVCELREIAIFRTRSTKRKY